MIKFSKYLFFIALLLTPLYGIEFLRSINIQIPYGIYLRAIKDLSMVLLIISMITRFLSRCTINRKLALYYIIVVGIFLLAFINSYYALNGLVFILGYRTFLPFLLVGFGFYFFNHNDIEKLNSVLNVLFGILLVLLIYQSFFLKRFETNFLLGMYRTNLLGLRTRVPGFFFRPAAASLFLVFFALFKKTVYGTNKYFWIIVPFLLLVNSFAGLSIWLAMLLLSQVKRATRWLIYSMIVLALSVFLLFYPLISGRSNYYVSVYTRIRLFYKSISNAGIFGNFIGYGNNFFITLVKNKILNIDIKDIFISDSAYASIIGQTGLLGGLLYIFFIVYLLINGNKGQYLLAVFIALAGFAIIWYESFPINFLVPLLIGYFQRTKNSRMLTTRI